MSETEATWERVTRSDLRHDRHTISLLTDHLVFSPKYIGKELEGEVAEAAGEFFLRLQAPYLKYGYSDLRCVW
jgi:hypothetical protein